MKTGSSFIHRGGCAFLLGSVAVRYDFAILMVAASAIVSGPMLTR